MLLCGWRRRKKTQIQTKSIESTDEHRSDLPNEEKNICIDSAASTSNDEALPQEENTNERMCVCSVFRYIICIYFKWK